MAESKFSKGEAIKFGWSTTTGNLRLFVFAVLTLLIIQMMPVLLTKSVVVMIVGTLLGFVVTMGIMRMSLRFVDGDRGELVDLFATFPLLINYILATIVVSIIVMVGMLFFVIPGIILGIRLQMYTWAIVDKQVGPIEALQQSWEMTRGSAWNLFLLGLLLGLVNILGMLALGVGMLVTGPLSMVAIGHAYRELETAYAA
jgi:uncharacterized membrane protein